MCLGRKSISNSSRSLNPVKCVLSPVQSGIQIYLAICEDMKICEVRIGKILGRLRIRTRKEAVSTDTSGSRQLAPTEQQNPTKRRPISSVAKEGDKITLRITLSQKGTPLSLYFQLVKAYVLWLLTVLSPTELLIAPSIRQTPIHPTAASVVLV